MLSFQNSGLMDRLFFFLYSQLWNISFSWTMHHRTQWLCTSNYWSWRFSSRKMKQGYRCHLSLKGPLSATVPKGKEFPSGTRLVVMWKGNESPHWDRGHDHICEANCHTPAFLVPWRGLSQSFLLGSLWRRCKQQKPAGPCTNRCWSLRGQPACRERASSAQPWGTHCGGALLAPATAGSCFFLLHNRCLEKLATMPYGFYIAAGKFSRPSFKGTLVKTPNIK